jgi:hypothetical protein
MVTGIVVDSRRNSPSAALQWYGIRTLSLVRESFEIRDALHPDPEVYTKDRRWQLC